MSIRSKITGKKKFSMSLKNYSKAKKKEASRELKKIGVMVQSEAVRSIQRGGRTGVQYGSHQASGPGEPPKTETGNLASNILVEEIRQNGVEFVAVVSRAEYSFALEFGTRTMEPRPFLRPAYDRVKNSVAAKLASSMRGNKK